MNVKSIAGQLGERRAGFASSSHSAHSLVGHWSLPDYVRPHKATCDDACRVHRARRIEQRSSSTWSANHSCRGSCHCRGSWSRRCPQHVVRRGYRCGHDSHRDAANSPRQGLSVRGACPWTLSWRFRSADSGFGDELTAAALLACTILFYIVVYTAWLKRATRQNIVIGGAAGALPPVIGWAAATGDVGHEPLALFLIIFLWTPPHFWALALNRTDDYARAGVPMLPVVAGRAATTRQILIYSGFLVLASELPWALGFAGTVYGAIAAICGLLFLLLALQLNRSIGADRRAAHRLFVFSISYLFVLFATLLVDHGGGSLSPMRSSPGGRTVGSVDAELLPGAVRSACCTVNFSEV